MCRSICLLLFCGIQTLVAVTSGNLFVKYPNTYFIESGTYIGDSVQRALDAGFAQIYSMELALRYYNYSKSRFQEHRNVEIIYGDSSEILPALLKHIDAPATFWLDGHYSWEDTGKGKTNSPILLELEAIAKHPIKTHTILVDDLRQCGTVEFDFVELDEIIEKIYAINPNYTVSFEDGLISNDILVAKIP